MDIYEETAEMLSNSMTVGPYASKDQILTLLHERYPDEDELRVFMDKARAAIKTSFEDIRAEAKRTNTIPCMLIPAGPGREHATLVPIDTDTEH